MVHAYIAHIDVLTQHIRIILLSLVLLLTHIYVPFSTIDQTCTINKHVYIYQQNKIMYRTYIIYTYTVHVFNIYIIYTQPL